MENNIVPFAFHAVQLQEAYWIDGKPYFTRRAIGEFLEYSHPEQNIAKLVNRNPHIEKFQGVVKLTTPGGLQDTFVYDPIGLQLIINKSNQPKAIEFQVAVAELVVQYVSGKLVPSKWSPKGDYSAIRQILSAPGKFSRKSLIADYAAREGISLSSAYRRINRFGRLKTLSGAPRRTRNSKTS